MSVVTSQKKSARADWHRALIVASLRMAGWSLRRLSVAHGLSEHTLKTALDVSYPKAEKIIADAIGLDPQTIWPQRYAKRNFTPVLGVKTKLASKAATSQPETTTVA